MKCDEQSPAHRTRAVCGVRVKPVVVKFIFIFFLRDFEPTMLLCFDFQDAHVNLMIASYS
jgi:hypothetical protein